ncbi:MAG: ECF transporter S component [Lachnospiraceae bacterium]|nr:ECF transporter S component [Lachnospiraceae bacterium]
MKETKKGKFGAREIAFTALLLAVCLVSQLFKNMSVYITGPVINACLVLAVFAVNLPCALCLSIITPVTAFLITGAPVMSAVPVLIPLIMLGNCVLVVCVFLLMKRDAYAKESVKTAVIYVIKAVICSGAKAAVMGLTISLWALPTFLPMEGPLRKNIGVFQNTFSIVQLTTALIGFAYVYVIWAAVKHTHILDKQD